MKKILNWFKWLLWDSWHGTSVSAFDERRTQDPNAPVIEIGSLRISRLVLLRLLQVLAVVLAIVIGGLLLGRFMANSIQTRPAAAATVKVVDDCTINYNGATYINQTCMKQVECVGGAK